MRRPAHPLRILVVGSHASAKTTLASWIAEAWGLPFLAEVARVVLEKRPGPKLTFDKLRLDVDATNDYQRQVMRTQIEEEAAIAAKPEARRGYVSDRSFDNLAYAAKHAEVVAELARTPELRRYVSQLRRDADSGRAVVFFTRPHPSMAVPDGGRAVGDLDMASIYAIDGMVQLLLELGDSIKRIKYHPIESPDPKMRRYTVENTLEPLLGPRQKAKT